MKETTMYIFKKLVWVLENASTSILLMGLTWKFDFFSIILIILIY